MSGIGAYILSLVENVLFRGLAQPITARMGHFDEAQSRYMAHLAKAYYLFGLGLRQEVLSALGS